MEPAKLDSGGRTFEYPTIEDPENFGPRIAGKGGGRCRAELASLSAPTARERE
jgi:hypothetical protein